MCNIRPHWRTPLVWQQPFGRVAIWRMTATQGENVKYRKKPVVIEAVQWTEDTADELGEFCPAAKIDGGADGSLKIVTLEGTMRVDPGDWVIKGVQGEFYPCKPDIFEATYDKVDD